MHRIPVQQIMNDLVITINPDDLVADAANSMDEHNLRRLPVVDEDGFLVGIITDSDVLEAETAQGVFSSLEPGVEGEWLAVADVMTREVLTVTPETTVGQLVELMLIHKFGGFPVVQSVQGNGSKLSLVGIVTETDVFQMIADAWHDYQDHPDPDQPKET